MASSAPVEISVAVEGDLDEAIVRRVARCAGIWVRRVHGKKGKAHLREHIQGYNNAAHFCPWLVLVDLDRDADCAPPLRSEWLPQAAQGMCFRIAVREAESWLMGDRERLARFLAVPKARIPSNPEAEIRPKQTLVNLARSSRRRSVREDMVPRQRSGRSVGPLYVSRITEFVMDVNNGWRPKIAAEVCDSLARCVESLSLVRGRGQ